MKVRKGIYMVVDLKNKELPLCVGTIEEVSAFADVTKASLLRMISNSKKKGVPCKYLKIGEEYIEQEYSQDTM